MPETRTQKDKQEHMIDSLYKLITEKSDAIQNSIDQQNSDILSIRDVVIKNLQDENAALKSRIASLEERVENMESESIKTGKNSYQNDQYLRQNNIEIDGIPNEITDDQLEPTVKQVLYKIGVNLFEIEDCHRLKERRDTGVKTTIVRFVNRRASKAALKNKKKLRGASFENMDSKKIFISDNLNSYYKNIAAKCRRLKKRGLITNTWTNGGLVLIKTLEEKDILISHQSVLDKLFPNITNYFEE